MNCTTPTRLPWPSMRSARPKAAVDLALARPGVDDQQALLDRLVRHLGVLHRLALGHLGAVARRLRLSSMASFMVSLHLHRQSRDHAARPVGARRDPLVEPALPHRGNAAPARCPGTMPSPTSLVTSTEPALARHSAASSRADLQRRCRARPASGWYSHRSGNRPARSRPASACDRAGRSSGASTVCQPSPRRRGARRSAPHLVIERLRGRDIDPRRRQRRDQRLGIAALAGARAAEHQGQLPAAGSANEGDRDRCGTHDPTDAYTRGRKTAKRWSH